MDRLPLPACSPRLRGRHQHAWARPDIDHHIHHRLYALLPAGPLAGHYARCAAFRRASAGSSNSAACLASSRSSMPRCTCSRMSRSTPASILTCFKTDITRRRFIIAGVRRLAAAAAARGHIHHLGHPQTRRQKLEPSAQARLSRSHLRHHPLLVAGEARRLKPAPPHAGARRYCCWRVLCWLCATAQDASQLRHDDTAAQRAHAASIKLQQPSAPPGELLRCSGVGPSRPGLQVLPRAVALVPRQSVAGIHRVQLHQQPVAVHLGQHARRGNRKARAVALGSPPAAGSPSQWCRARRSADNRARFSDQVAPRPSASPAATPGEY